MKLIAINSISYVNDKRKVVTAAPGELFEVDDKVGEYLMGRWAARKLTKDELDLANLRESEAKPSKKSSSKAKGGVAEEEEAEGAEEAPKAKGDEAKEKSSANNRKNRQVQAVVPDF